MVTINVLIFWEMLHSGKRTPNNSLKVYDGSLQGPRQRNKVLERDNTVFGDKRGIVGGATVVGRLQHARNTEICG